MLNLPSGTSSVKEVSFEVEEGDSYGIVIENGTLKDNKFTVYLPCDEIKLDKDKKVTVSVLTEGDESLVNTFFSGTQTLHEGHVILLTTTAEKWVRILNGKGSEADPYMIENVDDLINVRNIIAVNSFIHFKMASDIDMSSVKDWTPINPVNEPFGIMFDGDGHKISGFTCSSADWASFFGVLHGTV